MDSVNADGVIDRSALARLDQLGGEGFARRIIGVFLTEAPARIRAVRAACDKRDATALAFAAHTLVSSSGNVGARDLMDRARRLEQGAESGRWDELSQEATDLEDMFQRVCAALPSERPEKERM